MPAKVKRKSKKDSTADEEPTAKQAKGDEASTSNGDTKAKPKKEDSLATLPEGTDTSFPTEFNPDKVTADGRKATLKITSWNVNGLRAWLKGDGLNYLKTHNPDILCVQETKCSLTKLPKEVEYEGYHAFWYSADTEGYAGTGMYTKTKPISLTNGIGIDKHDSEGRIITAEFEKFFLVTSYVPNSGKGLVRLNYRTKEWDIDFRGYLKKLDAKKPVILCGDLNVAHTPADLKNPKTNKKTPGFTEAEREEFTKLLGEGYVDSFRELYPNARDCFSFWTYMMNARAKNVGWRLDYFVLSERLKTDLCDSIIQQSIMGSDHCPIMLSMALDL
ncbi:DNA-(apurinic or apyrimidinic site) lyase-like [Mizuhopecten yessoensis]|uniref:exodeoxyribonuclease III n=1 Tax=Mizuhopecten yessoensis TaxID=6573 RepID=A0A210Q010_MIZYE|nr:DNA-(apurinic or apyrimidinic site) lyase-like [Mizuhopecten yessoensis]OWF42055.1 DNA-(apurinic or apyrimidinic site) lyase [Mizuhopecten yessoensis]